jgi:UDP-2-acetamido-2,6-beta-L-arabino-hexul-4-ose reductase
VEADLHRELETADVVFHLAGVNRPNDPAAFETENVGLTKKICDRLRGAGRTPAIVFASSIQAELSNPYGISKLKAEGVLREFGDGTGASIRIFRLKNIFGRWCRPNYNSVTATFCHNIAHDLPITISDPAKQIELTYVDDVVSEFLKQMDSNAWANAPVDLPGHRISLGDLAGRIQAFHDMRISLFSPDFAEPFNRALYATYLSYVPTGALESNLHLRSDERGCLAEFIKSGHMGQVFISRTRPGVSRGNHYHHNKAEKFLVVEGEAIIRIRGVGEGLVREYRVRGNAFQAIDIPPWFTHSITNVGPGELVSLFWSDEIFDPDRPDTYYLPVEEAPLASEGPELVLSATVTGGSETK